MSGFVNRVEGPCPMCWNKNRYDSYDFDTDTYWLECQECGHRNKVSDVAQELLRNMTKEANRIEEDS